MLLQFVSVRTQSERFFFFLIFSKILNVFSFRVFKLDTSSLCESHSVLCDTHIVFSHAATGQGNSEEVTSLHNRKCKSSGVAHTAVTDRMHPVQAGYLVSVIEQKCFKTSNVEFQRCIAVEY